MVLNIEETVQKLRQYRNVSFPILSVYLQIPQTADQRNKLMRKQFQQLVDTQISPTDVSLYQADVNYIAAFLDTYTHTDKYKGIALFSGDNKLWEVITTHDELPNKLTIAHSPNLKPLLNTLSTYRRFLVILADREKARYFTLHMGQVESQGGVEDPSVPQKVTGRGANELHKKFDQHVREHLNKHMKFIGSKVNDFAKNKQISGVIIGGHKETLRNLRENLPQNLQKKIMGEFVSELNTSMNTIVEESKKIVETINSKLNQQEQLQPV